jgi:hypothetical protein
MRFGSARRRAGGHSKNTETIAPGSPPENTAAELSDEWARHLHASYLNRFISDNNRIWSTASIFIPLSLAAFPALFSLKSPTVPDAIVLAAVSTILLFFWFAVAERHRTFQDHYIRTVIAIEKKVAGGTGFEDILARAHVVPRGRKWLGVRRLRILLLFAVGGGWIVVIVAFLRGWLP